MCFPSYWQAFPDVIDRALFAVRRVRAADGCELTVYEAGAPTSEPMLLVCPFATPFLLVARLAAALAHRFRVISWENRAGPFLDGAAREISNFSPQTLSTDLRDIAAATAPEPAHYFGWCGGALPILRATHELGLAARSVCFLSPSDFGAGGTRTEYQTYFLPMLESIANGQVPDVEAAIMAIKMASNARPTPTVDDVTIAQLCSLNLQDTPSALQLCQLVRRVAASPGNPVDMLKALSQQVPVSIVHCLDDDVVSYTSSIASAHAAAPVRVVLPPSGGHFAVYKEYAAVAAEITASASLPAARF